MMIIIVVIILIQQLTFREAALLVHCFQVELEFRMLFCFLFNPSSSSFLLRVLMFSLS